MSKQQTKKTDNSHFEEKVLLRIESLPELETINVLDCFAGEGRIWSEVKKRTGKNIRVLRIEAEKDKGPVALRGDNLKFLPSLNLSAFDVIDLDAYGSPVKQLSILFRANYKGVVHCTFIQTLFGGLDYKMLADLGYSENMVKKCPTLFFKHALQKMLSYLHIHGVSSITGYFGGKKNYFYFLSKSLE